MPEEITTGATPDDETPPVTGDTEPTGETPKATPTIEELQKLLAERESALKATRQESIKHRKRLEEFEAEQRKAEEAKLSELERTKKRLADLESERESLTRSTQERIVRYEVQLAAARMNIVDPDAACKLLDLSELEYDDTGQPTNVDKVLKKLIEDKPYLVKQEPAPGAPRTHPGTTNPARASTGNAGVQHVTYDQYLQMPQHERTRAMREGKLKIITQ